MKDLGPLTNYLGIEVLPFSSDIFLFQQKYARDILFKASMLGCKLIGTSLTQKHNLHAVIGPLVDATNYRNIVGALPHFYPPRSISCS